MAEQVQLHYAASQSTARRRRAVWVIVAGIAVFSFVLVIKQIQEPVRVRYYQYKCMNYTLPPNTVVYEEDHSIASRLAGGIPHGPGWSTLLDKPPTAGAPPNILAYWASTPDCWYGLFYFRASIFRRTNFSAPLVYMHERKSAGMDGRLVLVKVNQFFALRGNGDDPAAFLPMEPALDWVVMKPESVRSAPTIAATGSWQDSVVTTHLPKPLTIYAAQSDPLDDSHFVIQFKMPLGSGKIDGWLLNNDRVDFQTSLLSSTATTQPQ